MGPAGPFALNGPKFGRGLGACGACTVLVEGRAERSCLVAARDVEGRSVVTLEGLGAGRPDGLHPVQRAWIDERVPQCGYCQNGQIRRGIDLTAPPASSSGARIPLETKRGLLRHIADAHGLATVYAIRRDIRHAPFDPILHMLLGASRGGELVERWQRMERYVHSRHRLRT